MKTTFRPVSVRAAASEAAARKRRPLSSAPPFVPAMRMERMRPRLLSRTQARSRRRQSRFNSSERSTPLSRAAASPSE